MLGVLYALITVLAWGTWLAPSQRVPLKNQQVRTFFVASANLVIASLVAGFRGFGPVTTNAFWMPLVGGLIWAVSGLCAFTAANRLGMARAFGIWAPLNILVSLACGRWLFGEFADLEAVKLALLGIAIVVILVGVLMIILAKGGEERTENRRAAFVGLMAALGAGILWGVYFIPIKLAGVSLWVAAFPMAIGIFVGSALLTLLTRASIRLRRCPDYLRLTATGVLWTTGNYGMLLLVGELGTGRGYTIAQLSVVVNAIVGIYALKEPAPRTRAARLTLVGCVLATVGGILLGQLSP